MKIKPVVVALATAAACIALGAAALNRQPAAGQTPTSGTETQTPAAPAAETPPAARRPADARASR